MRCLFQNKLLRGGKLPVGTKQISYRCVSRHKDILTSQSIVARNESCVRNGDYFVRRVLDLLA
jgi:hypothetical protein